MRISADHSGPPPSPADRQLFAQNFFPITDVRLWYIWIAVRLPFSSSKEEGLFMHPAILGIGIALGTQLVTQISDHVPKLNMERTCKGRIADDKILGFQQHQPYTNA
jgi:hypothetical protein